MKQFKKALCTMLLIPCLMPASQAEDLPSAQFSVDIWPYRQETNCDEIAPTAAPEILPTAPVVTQSPNVTIAPTAAPTLKPGGSNSTGDYTTDLVTTQEYLAWNLLNQDRIANGLPALPLDEELCRLARIKSTDMKQNNYFAHVSPTYGSAADMLRHFGYKFNSVGENIAHHATVEKSQAAFMSSTGHRQNILGNQWSRVGIGVTYDDQGAVYVTQLFVR